MDIFKLSQEFAPSCIDVSKLRLRKRWVKKKKRKNYNDGGQVETRGQTKTRETVAQSLASSSIFLCPPFHPYFNDETDPSSFSVIRGANVTHMAYVPVFCGTR